MKFFIAFVIIILVSECYSLPASTPTPAPTPTKPKKRESQPADPSKISPFLESFVTSSGVPPQSTTLTVDYTVKTFTPTTQTFTEKITESPGKVIVGPQTVVLNGSTTLVLPATTEIETNGPTTITKVFPETLGSATATIYPETIEGNIPDITTVPLPTSTPIPTLTPIPSQTNGARGSQSVFSDAKAVVVNVISHLPDAKQIEKSVRGVLDYIPSAGQVLKAGKETLGAMTKKDLTNAALKTCKYHFEYNDYQHIYCHCSTTYLQSVLYLLFQCCYLTM